MKSDRLTVWAPRAQESVTLVLPDEDRSVDMTQEDGGWWSAPALPDGTDYAFSIDGGPAIPDPRGPWQPHGVHGPSRTFDAAPGRPGPWTGRDARGAVHYELHIGTFTPGGTLDSAIEKLDHLVDLGVEMVELMPVAAFDGNRGWGYDGVGLYAVHAAYGGPAALQRFVAAAHDKGLAVCLDVVYNHLGPTGNYLGQYGPYFSDRHSTPWGDAVNLDGPDSGPVRAFIIDNALRWFADFGIDALRLDAVHALVDDSDQHLLAELADRTDALEREVGRPLSLTAESDLNQPAMVEPTSEGGLGMEAQWADDVHHALHTLVTGERHGYYVDFGDLEILEKALTKVFVHGGEYSTFREQVWGAPVPIETGGHKFVVCAQNHDQVGNRALGDRPSRVLTPGQLAIEAAVVLAGPFTPMLFMGEEWGATTPFQFFVDFSEEWLAEAVREGRSKEFGSHGWDELYGGPVEVPDPTAPSTFADSKLDWSEPTRADHARLLDFYKALIALRSSVPEISSDDRTVTSLQFDPEDQTWFVLHRGGAAIVANLADSPRHVPLAEAPRRRVLLAWEPATLDDEGLLVPGHDVVVLGAAEG